MKKLLLMAAFFTAVGIYAQAPDIEWEKSLGGSNYDKAYSIQQTYDGGYIVAGETRSNDGDVSGYHEPSYPESTKEPDAWIVKLNSVGTIEWQKSLGGSDDDKAFSIKQTTDGGYIMAGETRSNDGDVYGLHSSSYDYVTSDAWIVKLKSTGVIEWQKCLGTGKEEWANSIQQTTDGGYVMTGVGDNDQGYMTLWVVKLDTMGTVQWEKLLGGSLADYGISIQQTTDGGYIVAGGSYSNDGDVSGHHGSSSSDDSWIIKLSPAGNIQWQKSLGGTERDQANSIIQTSDGGYIFVGTSRSNDGDVTGNHGSGDAWVVKLNSSGNIQWEKSLGGSDFDTANSVKQTTDGGYIIAGSTASNDGHVTVNNGNYDGWLVKLNSAGSIQWEKSIGGSSTEEAQSIQQTADGGFIVAGSSNSNDGDVSGNHGLTDYWIVKLSPEPLSDPCEDKIIMDCGVEYTADLIPGSGSWENYTDVIYDYTGSEKVFEFTPAVSGNYKFNVDEGIDDADFFLMDGCSNEANNLTPTSNGYWNGFDITQGNIYLDAGVTYYLIADLYKYSVATTVTVSVDCLEPAEMCDWRIRVWGNNAMGVTWELKDGKGNVVDESPVGGWASNSLSHLSGTYNLEEPVTFTLNADTSGNYQSVNYYLLRDGAKIEHGRARDEMIVHTKNCSDESSATRPGMENSLTDFDFTYHPNPVKDVLYINSVKEIKSIQAFNTSGQLVLKTDKELNSLDKVDVTTLPKGVYVFRAILEDGIVETFKVVKK